MPGVFLGIALDSEPTDSESNIFVENKSSMCGRHFACSDPHVGDCLLFAVREPGILSFEWELASGATAPETGSLSKQQVAFDPAQSWYPFVQMNYSPTAATVVN